jgi:hypothetical protein
MRLFAVLLLAAASLAETRRIKLKIVQAGRTILVDGIRLTLA